MPAPPHQADATRARLRGIAEDQIAELVERGDALWRTQDGPDRAEAPDRALFDETPEGARLARYLNDAARLQHRALTELRRLRREGSRGLGPSALGVSEEGVEGSRGQGVEGSRDEKAPDAKPAPPPPTPHAPRETNPAPGAIAPNGERRSPIRHHETNPAPLAVADWVLGEPGALGRL